MNILATAHKIDDKWVALPSLSVDFFIGVMQPNEPTIRKNSLPFKEGANTEHLKENQVLYGKFHYRTGSDFMQVKEFEVLDEDGASHMQDF